ncbi:MAG: hypothetical protein QM758_23835 [Armatimonas sp.]
MSTATKTSLFSPSIVRPALKDAFVKLNPKLVSQRSVMFVVGVGSVLSTVYFVKELITHTGNPFFTGQVALWLWFTVLFANFAEAMAEGRGKAQADSLRKTKTNTSARKWEKGKRSRGACYGTSQGRYGGLRSRGCDSRRRYRGGRHRECG